MSLLGGLELSALRQTAQSSMSGTAVVYRRVSQSDGAGGQTAGSVVAVGTFPVRAIPVRSRPTVGQFAGAIEARADWSIYFAQGTDVQPHTDYVVTNGGTFDVLATNSHRSIAVELRVDAKERR